MIAGKTPPPIDCEKVRTVIGEFIRVKTAELGRDGAVLGLSGGLDSSLVAALCVEALGKDKVTGLILPDSEGNPGSRADALIVAEWLRIKTRTKDISRALRAIGEGPFLLSGVPLKKIKEKVIGAVYTRLEKRIGEDPFLHLLGGPKNPLLARGNAHFKTKHRMRMLAVYHYAESLNLLVAGTANRTEKLTGLFCKFGVDHCADIMPIAPLYRTQVFTLAEHMEIPKTILLKPSSPDMLQGMGDKYTFLTKLSAGELDLVLHRLGGGMNPEAIAAETGTPVERVFHVQELNRRSRHMRHAAMEPEL